MTVLEFNLANVGDFKETVKFIFVKVDSEFDILAREERGSDNCKNGIVILFNALDFNIGNINSGNIKIKTVFAVIVKNLYLNFA